MANRTLEEIDAALALVEASLPTITADIAEAQEDIAEAKEDIEDIQDTLTGVEVKNGSTYVRGNYATAPSYIVHKELDVDTEE